MALIDLQTDLKSLKYGKDRIGGGSSNQPFVQKPIPDSFSAVGNTGGLDVLTRGGSLVFQRTADDVSRLTKLLLTGNTFQGPFFTIKQNVLSRQGVQTQASPKGLNEGAYLPTNTLAQVAVSATGLHFNKQGLNPIPGTPGSLTTYSDIIEGSFLNPGIKSVDNNRLIKFTDNFVNSRSGNTLYSYSGGPGSILGLGKTSIQTPVDQRTGINSVTSNYKYDGGKIAILQGSQRGSNLKLLYGASNNAFDLKTFDTISGLTYSSGLEKEFIDITFGAEYEPALITKNIAAVLKPGDRTSGINQQVNSFYTAENDLTGSLYQPVTGVLSNSGQVLPEFDRKSRPSEEADTQSQALGNAQAFTYTQEELKTAPSYRTSGQIQDFRT